jgi:hypothetical protein
MDNRKSFPRPNGLDAKKALEKALFLKNVVLILFAALLFWMVMFKSGISDSFTRLGMYALAAFLIFLLGNWLDGFLGITQLSEKVRKIDAMEAERKRHENRPQEEKDE